MGRCPQDIKDDFRGSSEKMRLFLASLFLDLASDGMPPPLPRMPKASPLLPSPPVFTPTKSTESDASSSSSDLREQPMRQAKLKDIPSPGLHLKIEGVSAGFLSSDRISTTEKNLILHGHTPLGVSFDFTEADLREVREFYSEHEEEIMMINNTLRDVEIAEIDKSSVGKGRLAPRSMIDCSINTPGYDLQAIQKIVRVLSEAPALSWLTKTRPNWSFKLLRSLPDTVAQFWHRDYCFKSRGVNSMFWHAVPLFMIAAIDFNTELDFLSGSAEIMRGKAEIGRGDEIHRGSRNDTEISHYRVFVAFDSTDSTPFRMTANGDDTFEPASVRDQKKFNSLFLKSNPVKRPTNERKRN
jgi:hypothetical protein